MAAKFNSIIDNNPPADKVKEDLDKLREEAINKNAMNYRQVDGIVSRIKYYMDGTYGKTKTMAQINSCK